MSAVPVCSKSPWIRFHTPCNHHHPIYHWRMSAVVSHNHRRYATTAIQAAFTDTKSRTPSHGSETASSCPKLQLCSETASSCPKSELCSETASPQVAPSHNSALRPPQVVPSHNSALRPPQVVPSYNSALRQPHLKLPQVILCSETASSCPKSYSALRPPQVVPSYTLL